MASLPWSLKVLEQCQRVFFPLHLQRVTDMITAVPVEIYPESLWHFIDFGQGWLRASVQQGDG